MKQILTLILLLSLFACNKDEDELKPLSEQRTEKQIFDAIIGTWKPGRLAYDENFKEIEEIEYNECSDQYRVNFQKDSTLVCTECTGKVYEGWFYVQIGSTNSIRDTDVHINFPESSIWLSPTISHVGGAVLHHYTDSTLVFSEVGHKKNGKHIWNLYSEFKRVK